MTSPSLVGTNHKANAPAVIYHDRLSWQDLSGTSADTSGWYERCAKVTHAGAMATGRICLETLPRA